MNPNYLTPQQAATYSGYSLSSVYKFIHYNKLEYKKPNGGKVYISKKSLDQLMGFDEN